MPRFRRCWADHAIALHLTEQGDSIIVGKSTATLVLGEYTQQTSTASTTETITMYLDFASQRLVGLGHFSRWSRRRCPGPLSVSATGSPVLSFISNSDGSYGTHAFDQRQQYDMGLWLYETDLDFDGVLDGLDNCPKLSNSDQANLDNDAFGDLCDDDIDGDGVPDVDDDCPTGDVGWVANSMSDHDSDGCRDLTEDLDDDEDGIFDEYDLCPKGPVGWVSTEESDIESDGCSDIDGDGDSFVDQADNCPNIANPTQADLDNDGVVGPSTSETGGMKPRPVS